MHALWKGVPMLGRIVEITGEGRRLSLERGFLSVSGPDGRLGTVALDDIEAVILSHPAASLTSQAVSALALRGAPLVICGGDFKPSAYVLPVSGYFAQGERIEAQAQATLPTRKRLWADIVRAKIVAQASALERIGGDGKTVKALAVRVNSGDGGNLEAVAAQRYFPAMFGTKFVRGDGKNPINAFLNYGYTVLRAATARAIVAAGLHPSLSIAHHSRGEALRLADDLMEPFRPAVDLLAYRLSREGVDEMTPESKRTLAEVLHADYDTDDGASPLSNVLARLTLSLVQVYLGQRRKLAFAKSPIPMAETVAAR